MDDFAADLDRFPALQGMLGYLNFSEGKTDPRFQSQLNETYAALAEGGSAAPWTDLARLLRAKLDQLQAQGSSAFQDAAQARAVIGLVFDRLLPRYRQHHADLLFHQGDRDLFTPFFLARAAEAVLAQGPPWQEEERVVNGALRRLNDFVGHRPVAVLESRPQGEPYPHERVRPVPLYLRDAGVGWGRYAPLVSRALDILAGTSPDILAEAYFDPKLLDELAFDPRAFDQGHPVNRRPNYVFGEWDPHHIDNQGRYRRYVVRQITLDALLDRVERAGELAREEVLFEAAAVLAGTLLMATGISGAGPETHDSSTTLSNLMPRVARYRDAFYAQLLDRLQGSHRDRLRHESAVTRQPFGAARQHLNQYLARHRAALLQNRHLALILAGMGYPEASRRFAAQLPAASVRLSSEIHNRLAEGLLRVDRGEPAEAARLAGEVEELLHRGIDCGALPDPWNILGFQGQFPLFHAMEDSVRDTRIDELVALVEQLLNLFARVLSEAGARGDEALLKSARQAMGRVATWWDRFASVEVSGVRRVHGGETLASAEQVAEALGHWHRRGEAPADLAFWRKHLPHFRSPKAFALVVDALLRKEDFTAAMALLINWLSQAEQVPLEEGEFSFHALAVRWMLSVSSRGRPGSEAGLPEAEAFALQKRFLDYLEANAEELWQVPRLGPGEPEELGMPTPVEEDLYGAAYEEVTYQDSTADGEEGEVMEGGPRQEFDLEAEGEPLLKRLRFLATVARLWQIAAWRHPEAARREPAPADRAETLRGWLATARGNRQALLGLLDALHEHPVPEPSGSYDSLVAFDRHRLLKEQLLSAAIATSLDATLAAGALQGATGAAPVPAGADDPTAAGWNELAVPLEQALFRGDAAAARALLPDFVERFRHEPLLFRPLADGGHPRQILRATLAQNILRGLLANLPRLGLLRETYHLLCQARAMEQAPGDDPGATGRRVTVFDQLFQIAFQAVIETIVDSASSWPKPPEDGRPLADLIDPAVEPFLKLWIEHSQTLRLSPLEAVRDEAEWGRLRAFIQRYGADLFHARFMTLANLRGILHRGVGAYLDYLAENPDPLHPVKLVEDLGRGIGRPEAEHFLGCILAALVENYEEYKDYNTTATQSDYGQNLHLLFDFLALKTSYDRQAWHLRPLVLAHEVLVRRGKREAARVWQEELARLTGQLADQHLADLADLERAHGLRLRTVTDRLAERFVRPLALDRLCALVEPAMDEARQPGQTDLLAQFERELQPYTDQPAGVGLDVPAWLRRLEAEVQRVHAARTALAGLAVQLAQVPRTVLSPKDLERQLGDWEVPDDETEADKPE